VPTRTQAHLDRISARYRAARKQAALWLALSLFSAFGGLLTLILIVSGESLPALISSVVTAFATAITSGLSAVSGNQWATIVSSVITLIGTISTTYLGIRWRRGRDQ
jgi:hypothetical protein